MAARRILRRHAHIVPESPVMTWSTYLPLRQSQRKASLYGALPTTVAAFFGGGGYFASLEADPTQTILGMESIYFNALCGIGCIGAGWIVGSVLGTTSWRLLHRRALPEMEIRHHQFQQHLTKYRADPSRQSVSNPVPDYYGEKIGSLRQYRQWLRDQRAYQRKAVFGNDRADIVRPRSQQAL